MAWSRANGLMAMTSPLGGDVLIPISLSAQEAISQPFQFDVVAVCQSGTIDPNALLNNPACVILQEAGAPVRYFHGIVSSVSAEGTLRSDTGTDVYQLYHLILVPRLWFLSKTADCRIHEQMSAGDILQAMFTDAGLTDLSGPPSSTARDSAVQFNETDLHFATRLMEEEGWFYFFQHAASSHTLVIANQNTAFTAISGATLYMVGGADGSLQLLDFNQAAVTVRGKMTLADYDPINPGTALQSSQPTVLTTGGAATRDDFRWPALTFVAATVTDRTNWEMQAAEAVASLYEGSSIFGGLVPGGQFTISSQPAGPYDGNYVVRSVTHQVSDDTWLNQSGSASYTNNFVAFPAATTWRQPMVTPRPRMNGVYTGLVMGPQSSAQSTIAVQSGEEIYTDDYARVKVRFFWDWRAESTGSNAIWARVIQPWAGNGWGTQFLPRVGTEVAVAFVDGDPDRPIVIGGLYNGALAPIYASSDKTKSGIRTRSSLSGSTSQFNELTFDDKASSELIFLHAEKDLFTEVENNQTLTVGNNRVVTVTQNETVAIQNNQTITVTQDRAVTVSQGNSTFEVSQGNHTETIDQGNNSLTVSTGNNSVTVSTGNNSLTVSTGNHSETITQGNYSINVNAGQMTVQAMQSLELTVGQSSIKLTPQGVTISGMQISLTGQLKGSFDGGTELDLKGGMVKLN
ncbi:MAG TPA: type VI secretion system tip protein TssI/VgrG [Acetobacteraceae bacterium]|nr:type VI secretion system tip protein TssI/VgrG [Acetobacteraceae bacterium]